MELINKQKFVEVALDKNINIFVSYIATLEALKLTMSMHLLRALLLAALQ